MHDRDLFAEDDNDNQLDFLKQNRNQRPAQGYSNNRNTVEQDLKVVDEDDDFNYHFDKKKPQREEEPQKLSDLLGGNNNDEPQNDYFSKNQSTRKNMAVRSSQGRGNVNAAPQKLDDFLYNDNNDNRQTSNNNYNNYDNNSYGNEDTQGFSSGFNSRPTTSGGRPGTSTSMNARAKLAEQQRARLAQNKTNTVEGGFVSNDVFRSSKTNDMYKNAKIDYGQSQTSSGFYDPSMQFMGQSNLPSLSSNKVVIKYNEDVGQSKYQAHYEAPSQQEAYQQEYRQQEPDSPKYAQKDTREIARTQSQYNEEEKASTVAEKEERDSSEDEQPVTESQMKQKGEFNKEKDAEIGIVNNDDQPPNTNEPMSKLLNLDLRDIADMKSFLMHPCPKGYRIECTIKRDRSGMARFYPKYHCYISNGPQYLMSAKKRGQNKTSNYLVAYNKDVKKNSAYCLGKVRSNFMGTEFNIFDEGLNPSKAKDIERLRSNLGVVLYESNLLTSKGPRKMKVYMPEVNESTSEIYQFKPLSEKEGILSNWKSGKRAGIKEFINKNPKWNEQLQAFVLNFNGRVEKPSVKNFQLIDERNDERIFLQFGRVTNDTFNMDFEWPLSPFQAFAICLSSFDYKIACE